jgi:GNAT superfamily N-acetyltransferase
MAHPTIRATRPTDAPGLPDVESSAGGAFLAVPGLAWLADAPVCPIDAHLAAIRAGTSWVAVDDADRAVAFLLATAHPDALHIDELSVHLAHQRQGLGRALVERAAAHARRVSLGAVTLTTFRDLAFNEGFYRSLGFVTLAPEALGARLTEALAAEQARGLPVARRCAMRLPLAG